jgi:hypothetical protein
MREFSAFRRARAALGLIGGAGLLLLLPTAAGAQEADPQVYGGGTTVTTVDPGDPGDPGDPQVAGTSVSSDGSLPFTGGDIAGLAAIGAGAIGVGVLATRARRSRTA